MRSISSGSSGSSGIGRLIALSALLGLATAARGSAQWILRGSGVVSALRHRVDAGEGAGVEPSSGVLGGGEVSGSRGDRLTVRLQAQAGSLRNDAPGAIARDVAEIGAQVELLTFRWLTAQVGARRRTYSTILARQAWTSVNVGAVARVPFSETGLNGMLRGAILPGVWVNGLGQPALAVALASGMEYQRGRASVAVLYSLERYRFAAAATPERREQIAGIAVSVGWRLNR